MFHGRLNEATATGLKKLRARIDEAAIPSSRLAETIILATWNIREFGRRRRSARAIHYIAEILGQFDLIAITEGLYRPNLMIFLNSMVQTNQNYYLVNCQALVHSEHEKNLVVRLHCQILEIGDNLHFAGMKELVVQN